MGMTALMFEAAKYAWSCMPRAAALVGDATESEIATWRDSSATLAARYGVAAQYSELAEEMISLGEPPVLARIVALWAARKVFGADERVTNELDGPSDDQLAGERLAFEAAREEAETRRFYREDFPAIAAARGQRVEESPAWQFYAIGGIMFATDHSASPPQRIVVDPSACLHAVPHTRQVDWSAERIREEYRRWWSTAERRFWDAEYAAAKPHAADDLEAARFATRRVLDRRIAEGTRPAPAAAAAAGASA